MLGIGPYFAGLGVIRINGVWLVSDRFPECVAQGLVDSVNEHRARMKALREARDPQVWVLFVLLSIYRRLFLNLQMRGRQ